MPKLDDTEFVVQYFTEADIAALIRRIDTFSTSDYQFYLLQPSL
jgi:hypothetical protein